MSNKETNYSYQNIFKYVFQDYVCVVCVYFVVVVVVQSLSHVQLLQTPWFPCPLLFPRVCSNLCSLSQRCYPAISSSVAPFSCLQSFQASGSFPMSWLFASGGQRIGAQVSAIRVDFFPLGLTGFIFLLSKGLSRVLYSTTV